MTGTELVIAIVLLVWAVAASLVETVLAVACAIVAAYALYTGMGAP